MSGAAVWDVLPVAISMLGPLLGVALGAFLNGRAQHRRQLAETRRAAYTRAVQTLDRVRQTVAIDKAFETEVAWLRDRRAKLTAAADQAKLLTMEIDLLTALRDRRMEHVHGPLLEVEAEIRLFGSAPVRAAVERAATAVDTAITADPGAARTDDCESALQALQSVIRRDLGLADR